MDGAWTSATILIPNVNGNLVITATATQRIIASINAVYTQSGTYGTGNGSGSLWRDTLRTMIGRYEANCAKLKIVATAIEEKLLALGYINNTWLA